MFWLMNHPPDSGGDAGPDDLHDGLGGQAPLGRPLDVDENIVDVVTKDVRM